MLKKQPVEKAMLAVDARKQRFAARPAAWHGGLRTAVALRAILVLGAAAQGLGALPL